MDKRQIGRSGIFITPFVLGGNPFGWTVDEPGAFAVLDAFAERGGQAIDTADYYMRLAPGLQGGESETMIGNWLAQPGVTAPIASATRPAQLADTMQALELRLSEAELAELDRLSR